MEKVAPALNMAIFGIYVQLLGNIQVDCGVNLLRIFAMVVAMNVWASLGLMANPSFKRMEMVISNHFPSKDLDHQVKIWIIMVVRVPSMYYIWLQNARPEPIPDTNPKKNMNIIEHQRTTFLESNKLGDPSFRPNKNNFGSLYPRNRP